MPNDKYQTLISQVKREADPFDIVLGRKQSIVLSITLEMSLTTENEDKVLGEDNIEWEPSVLLVTQVGDAQAFRLLVAFTFQESRRQLPSVSPHAVSK